VKTGKVRRFARLLSPRLATSLAALALLALQADCSTSPLQRSARSHLAANAGAVRPVEGRIAGVAYALWRSQGRLVLADRRRLRGLADELRPAFGRHAGHADLAAWGCLLLLAGQPAVPALERAVAAGGADAATLNDLGAAYLDAASPEGPAHLLKALELFERAVALSPAAGAARFNRALTLERLL
jgi:hypothetical protein